MLRLVEQGLRDMEQTDPSEVATDGTAMDRVLLGFVAVVVFGRSVTNALQNLRTFDQRAFEDWYEPWQREMRADPLLRWFYVLRSNILKGIAPLIAVVIGASGQDAPLPGMVSVPDSPPPDSHRKQPIQDRTVVGACRLYAAYLKEMVESSAEVIWAVNDRHLAKLRASNIESPGNPLARG
jgi:hypothetical protein